MVELDANQQRKLNAALIQAHESTRSELVAWIADIEESINYHKKLKERLIEITKKKE